MVHGCSFYSSHKTNGAHHNRALSPSLCTPVHQFNSHSDILTDFYFVTHHAPSSTIVTSLLCWEPATPSLWWSPLLWCELKLEQTTAQRQSSTLRQNFNYWNHMVISWLYNSTQFCTRRTHGRSEFHIELNGRLILLKSHRSLCSLIRLYSTTVSRNL